MKPITLWNAILSALSGICLLVVLVPVLYLMFGSTPGTLWETLKDPEVLESLGLTFFCGFIALLLGLLVGTPLAYLPGPQRLQSQAIHPGYCRCAHRHPSSRGGYCTAAGLRQLGSPAFPPSAAGTGIVIAMFFVSVSLLINAAQAGFSGCTSRDGMDLSIVGSGSGENLFSSGASTQPPESTGGSYHDVGQKHQRIRIHRHPGSTTPRSPPS